MPRVRYYTYAGVGALILTALVYCSFVDVYYERYEVCECTLSARRQVTWFGVVRLPCSYYKSGLERYIEIAYPQDISHKWVLVTYWRMSLLSGAHGCTNEPVGQFGAGSLDGDAFAEVNQRKVYAILVYASKELSRSQKKELYTSLANKVGIDLFHYVESFEIPSGG
jgi:hypothetical protein